MSEIVSQPSRSPISGTPGPPHSDSSLAQTRRATSCSTAVATRAAIAPEQLLVDRRRDRLRAAGERRLARGLDAGEQLVHRVLERLDAVVEQRRGDVVDVDAGVGQRGELRGRVDAGAAGLDLAALGDGQQRRQRHRVDRVGPDQLVDVHGLRVGRVLDPGRRPQRPLHRGAGGAQRGEALAEEDLLEAQVGGARVGERRGAREVGAPERLEPLVDLGVDARDEEARDRGDVERAPLGDAALEAADVGLGDRGVLLDPEQQRDVDVDALVDRLLDRGDAGAGAGDLDHHVRAVEPRPVVARLLERALGVVGAIGQHLERDEAVAVLVEHRPQHVGRVLEVGDRDPLEQRERVEPLAGAVAQLVVVVGRAEDRLLEDRRVGGDAAQRVLVAQARQLAARDQAAADLVEPRRGAGGDERGQAGVDGVGGACHVWSSQAVRSARARSTTVAAVMPKCA